MCFFFFAMALFGPCFPPPVQDGSPGLHPIPVPEDPFVDAALRTDGRYDLFCTLGSPRGIYCHAGLLIGNLILLMRVNNRFLKVAI